MNKLGRRSPTDWKHVEKYPLSAAALSAPATAEKSLGLPAYWPLWDQVTNGPCVGFGTSSMSGITNTYQLKMQGISTTTRFAPMWLYDQAQLVDEWLQTPPQTGTSVRAACDVLRDVGHRRVRNGVTLPIDLNWGIAANRWARTVDELRGAIYSGSAVSFGINWYASFDAPVMVGTERWIKTASGRLRGGHCTCLYRMSDRRQAFMMMNSWGALYPPVWVAYDVVQKLIDQDGEATVITDR